MAARVSLSSSDASSVKFPDAANPVTPSKSRRLSSYHIQPSKGQTPVAPTPATKTPSRRRQSFAARSRTIRSSATPSSTRSKHVRSQKPILSRAEIAEMYSSTIKLCQDNKINAKNTWNLNLIDYMTMLVKNDDSDQVSRTVMFEDDQTETTRASIDTNFQLAGVTLDAGVKIYCSRVDSVHSNAYKVLGGLSRTGNEDASDTEANSNGNESDSGMGNSNTRKNGAKRTGRATLESNMSNITSNTLETDLAVDPLFQKLSAAFDEGGAKGMLLNNLPVGPKGQIIFDSSESADTLISKSISDGNEENQSPGNLETYDVSKLLPPSPPTAEDNICYSFLRFFHAKSAQLGVTAAEIENEASHVTEEAMRTETENDFGVADFDYDQGDLENAGEEVTFFSEEQTHDDSIQDDDVINVYDGPESQNTRLSMVSNASVMTAQRGALDLIEAGVSLQNNSDYAFFDESVLSSWAGPQHWKFRAADSSVNKLSDGAKNGKKAKRPRKKTALLLDFSSDAPEIDFAAEFAPPKHDRENQLSESVKARLSEKKVTLPEDLHYSTKDLVSLFLRPGTVVKIRRNRNDSGQNNHNINDSRDDWYDFDNDCDTTNFCPAGDGQFFESNQDDMGMNDDNGIDGMELIPEPAQVEKIDIEYAKVAKKVDVRRLKSGMWSKLCGETSNAESNTDASHKELQGEDEEEENNEKSADVDIRTGEVQRLQEVVQDVSSFVPETSLPDVSFPYIFICLLHLANEKTLQISPAEDSPLKDLIITSGKEDDNE